MDDREVSRLLTLAANSPGGVWPPNALVKEGRKDRGMTHASMMYWVGIFGGFCFGTLFGVVLAAYLYGAS